MTFEPMGKGVRPRLSHGGPLWRRRSPPCGRARAEFEHAIKHRPAHSADDQAADAGAGAVATLATPPPATR
jgi:hypothetical protein